MEKLQIWTIGVTFLLWSDSNTFLDSLRKTKNFKDSFESYLSPDVSADIGRITEKELQEMKLRNTNHRQYL